VEKIFGRHFCGHEEIKVVRVFHPSQHNKELHPIHDGTRKTRCFLFLTYWSYAHQIGTYCQRSIASQPIQTDTSSLVFLMWFISGDPYHVKSSQNYENSLRVIFCFIIAFTWEQAFSSVKFIKSKMKSRLTDSNLKNFLLLSALSKNLPPNKSKPAQKKAHYKVSCEVYHLLYQIFRLHLTSLPGKSLTMSNNIVTR